MPRQPALDRRQFLGALASVAAAGPALAADAPSLARWRGQIGLQMYTVRDRYPTDYPGTLKAIAAIGYPAVQPTGSYAGHAPDAVKRLLDENRLIAATTHVSPPDGPQFEPTLEGYARIGHRYTTIRMAAPRAAGAPAPEPQALTREAARKRGHVLRPIARDPTLQPCQRITPAMRDSTAWPAAGAVAGTVYGEAFAALAPDRAAAVRRMGREIGASRRICRMNSAADVAGGVTGGRELFDLIARSPAFQTDLEAARIEVAAARAEGLSSPACAAERRALGSTPDGR